MQRLRVVMFVCVFWGAYQITLADHSPDWLKEAQAEYNTGNYANALALLSKAAILLTVDEHRYEADNIQAWSHYKQADWERALSDFQSMARTPGHKYQSGALFMTGRIHEAQGHSRKACLAYRDLLRHHSESNAATEATLCFAEAFLRLPAAEKTELIRESPDIAENTLYEAGRLFLEKKKEPSRAALILQELLTHFSRGNRAPGAMVLSAKAELDQGNAVSACQRLLDALSRFPESNARTEALDCLGVACVTLPEKEFLKLMSTQAHSICEAVYAAGWTRLMRHGQHEQAETLLDFFVTRFPAVEKWDDALMLLGRAKIKLGKNEEALGVYRRLFSSTQYNNHWNEAQAEVVRILADMRDWKQLKEESLKLYQYDHPRGKAYAVLSYVNACMALEDRAEAVRYLETIIAENAQDPYKPYYQQRLTEVKRECCGQ